jgi:hypothetical protein
VWYMVIFAKMVVEAVEADEARGKGAWGDREWCDLHLQHSATTFSTGYEVILLQTRDSGDDWWDEFLHLVAPIRRVPRRGEAKVVEMHNSMIGDRRL